MIQSQSIGAIATALAAASAEIKAVGKDRTNPHFKNKYATLDAIVDSVRPVLAKHGLAVMQDASDTQAGADGKPTAFTVETMLVHKSGEWIANRVTMPVAQSTPQGVGSALTYGRRYGLSALLSLATDEDDDGNAGSQQPARGNEQRRPPQQPSRATAPSSAASAAAAAEGSPSAAATDEPRSGAEAALRLLLADTRLTGTQRRQWEGWLEKPRTDKQLTEAIARVEDLIVANTEPQPA